MRKMHSRFAALPLVYAACALHISITVGHTDITSSSQ